MAEKPQILLTNDDGINSAGLWAAAEALSEIGFVNVTAPRQQYSGAGRSLPSNSDGIITARQVPVHGKDWTVYSVGGSPAQAVQHAVVEILPEKPDLVVSGINFGENVGSGITISGTVGAALEGAAMGIPALAVSLETDPKHHFAEAAVGEVDFNTAAYFTAKFAQLMLNNKLPEDVDVLKVDIPCDAKPETPWQITRLLRTPYYYLVPPKRSSWDQPGLVGYRNLPDEYYTPGTDAHAVRVARVVSVTPISMDLTSRTPLLDLDEFLRGALDAA
ncbi:MAG: 5'/3'-nucleotidase SurE [Anaerolineales bacterium]|jgi:5'-nucleotidase